MIKKVIVAVCFICFVAQSVYNIYINTNESKIVEIGSIVNMSSVQFPLQIQLIVEQGLDQEKMADLGFELAWNFYAPLDKENQNTFAEKNMTQMFMSLNKIKMLSEVGM